MGIDDEFRFRKAHLEQAWLWESPLFRATARRALAPLPKIKHLSGADAKTHIPSEVKFIPYTSILKLPVPWPRCQEIGHLHEKPVPGDNIVVISQAWSYQLHPDPRGHSVETVCALLKKAAMVLRTGGRMLVFCEYLCMPQPPITNQQKSLSQEEQHVVIKVLEFMPHLTFNADAVIHISTADDSPTPEDGQLDKLKRYCCFRSSSRIHVSCGNLEMLFKWRTCDASRQMTRHVVTDFLPMAQGSPLMLYDQVMAINGHVITCMEDLPEEIRTGKPSACSSACQSVFPSFASYWWQPTAMMSRAPYGYRIHVPAEEQGHMFFSNFISMVKVFERFYLWSLSALDGEPFEPLSTRLRNYAGSHFIPGLPELWHVGVQSLVPPFALKEPLLYLGFGRLLPCCEQEPAMKMLAYEQGCDIFCIGCEAVLPNLLEEDTEDPEHEGEAFYNDLFHLIDALPLTYRFYLCDSTYGLALPVLWKLWDRLSGVLAINPSWIFRRLAAGPTQIEKGAKCVLKASAWSSVPMLCLVEL
eukprot:g28675.t1